MAALALEYIVRLLILIVVAVVIIGLITTFSQDISSWWSGFTKSEDLPPKAEVIERNSFTAEEVANFVEGCWSSNLGSQQDNECYFLLGNLSSANQSSIVIAVNPNIIDPSKIIFDVHSITNALVITYDNYRREVNSEAIVIKGR